MRLACYGWVKADGGSVASANHTVVAELLRRGHHIDLYADREHVRRPPQLAQHERFEYVGLPPLRSSRLPARVYRFAELVLGPSWRRAWRRRFGTVAVPRHERDPYDAVLSLGVIPAFALPGVATVAWLQGPVQTELEAIRRLRPLISRTSGRAFYAALVSYYSVRVRRDRALLGLCDHVICPSVWSTTALARGGFPPERLHALPYPIDLDRFRPEGAGAAPTGGPLLLSVGRLDPRKRLDLLVGAFELIARERPTARLQVVGRPGYAPGQLSFIEASGFRDRIDCCPAVPQAEVPDLLRGADVLVQPSENENFGSAVAEALACGIPVVVGSSNGTADYIDSGSRVFSSYTARSVADAILDVVDRRRVDPGAAARSARATAERWFSVGAVVSGLEEILQRAVTLRVAPRHQPN